MKPYGYRWIFLLCAAAVTAFIWQQSTLAPVASSETSDAVRDVVVPAVGGPTTLLGGFLDRFLRKIAHFTEFGVLGLTVEGYLAYRHSLRADALAVAFGFSVASCDELLQLATGRGAAVSDVLLDVCGYLTFSLLLRATCFAALQIKNKRKAGSIPATQKDA